RPDRGGRPRARRVRRRAPVQPRYRRRRADGVPVRARERLRPRRPLRRGRAARPVRAAEGARARAGRRRRHRCRLAFRRGGRLPVVGDPPRRDQAARARRLRDRAAARHRHDLRLPGAEPQGARPLRRRLPARLPRGGGDGDDDQAPPPARRGAGSDARARARPLVDHRAPLDLLHGQGARRALRRPLPAQRRPGGGRVIAAQTPLKVSLAATAASLVLVLVVFELIRSRRLRERYALLWLLTGIVLVVLSAWRGGLNTIAAWFGVRGYPPAVLFAVGLLFVILVLLHYSTVISRLSDQNVVLAQRLALVEERLARGRSSGTSRPSGRGRPAAASGPRNRRARGPVTRRVAGAAGRSASTCPRRARPRSRSARRSSPPARGSTSRPGAQVDRLGAVVPFRGEHQPVDAIVDVEELARGGAVAPEHDLAVRLDHLPDQRRNHVRRLEIEVVARAVEVRRQEIDRVEPVLLAVGLRADEHGLLRHAVRRVRLLGVAVPEVVLRERHGRVL